MEQKTTLRLKRATKLSMVIAQYLADRIKVFLAD